MFEPQEIRTEHKDVIHDVLYDYYGQRIATCSSDQTVKVSKQLKTNSKRTGHFGMPVYSNHPCQFPNTDLGSKRKRRLDCVGQLESAFWFCVAFIVGSSGIWHGASNMLV